MQTRLEDLTEQIKERPSWRWVGSVHHIAGGLIYVDGISDHARIGDQAIMFRTDGRPVHGEIIEIRPNISVVMPYVSVEEITLGSRV